MLEVGQIVYLFYLWFYLNSKCQLNSIIEYEMYYSLKDISIVSEHNYSVLKRIFFLNESESRILFVIQKFFESESESYS